MLLKNTKQQLTDSSFPNTKYYYEIPWTLIVKLHAEKQASLYDILREQLRLFNHSPDEVLIITVEPQQIPFSPLTTLIEQHPNWGWQPGSFDIAFRELANVSRAYQDSNLDTAEAILAAEEARTGESLDAFGMKLPAEVALRWGGGAVLIWVVQLYLWVHLYEFRRKLTLEDEGWNVAWLGMYETFPARVVLY